MRTFLVVVFFYFRSAANVWPLEKTQWKDNWLMIGLLYFMFPLKCIQQCQLRETTDTHTSALSELPQFNVAFKRDSIVALLLLFFPINILCCVCVCVMLGGLLVNHSLSHWNSQMRDCVNTDVDLGPCEHFTCLISLCLSTGSSFCFWLCLYIFHVSFPVAVAFLFWSHNPAHLTKSQVTHSSLSFLLFNLVALPFSLLISYLNFFKFSHHPVFPFSFFSYSLLSCLCMFDISFCITQS